MENELFMMSSKYSLSQRISQQQVLRIQCETLVEVTQFLGSPLRNLGFVCQRSFFLGDRDPNDLNCFD
jgi:hypothetical protein